LAGARGIGEATLVKGKAAVTVRREQAAITEV